MTLKIAQETIPIDKSRWRWSVWLDAPAEELDNIKDVVWKLHPSFSPPDVRVDSRQNGFRLTTSGWGEFEVQAEIHRLNGEVDSLRHWLRFETRRSDHPETSGSQVAERQRAVFLSYTHATSADARLARSVAEALKRHNFQVFIDVDIPPGEDLRQWIYEKISESDAAVLLLSNRTASQIFTGYEVQLAVKVGIPIIAVITSEIEIPESLRQLGGSVLETVRIEPVGLDEDAQNIALHVRQIVSRQRAARTRPSG
jgi:hypothetical protein